MTSSLGPEAAQKGVTAYSQQRTAQAAVLLASTRVARAALGGVVALLVAYRFGASRVTDAFFVAETISVSLIGWLGPVLKVSVIPWLTEFRLRRGKEAGEEAAGHLLGASLPVLLAVTVIVVLAASPIMLVLAPGFDSFRHDEATRLTRLLAPTVILGGFFELVESVLNSNRHFTRPAYGRMGAKLGMMAGLIVLAVPYGITGVVMGILLGYVLQLALQLPLTGRMAPGYWRPEVRPAPELRPLVRLMGPALLWLAIDQVNVVVGQIFASALYPGKLSALVYAARLIQFAINILVGSLVAASLPSFSEHSAGERRDETRRLVALNLRMVLFVTVPAMAGLVVLRGPLVRALLERGSFNAEASAATSMALLGYTLGMAAISINMVCRVALFTARRMGTVLRLGAFEIGANAVLNAVFVRLMGHWGIALATSVAATITTFLLVRAVEAEFGQVCNAELLRLVGRVVLGTAAMSLVVLLVREMTKGGFVAAVPGSAIVAAGLAVLAGTATYGGACLLLRVEELARVRRVWSRRQGGSR